MGETINIGWPAASQQAADLPSPHWPPSTRLREVVRCCWLDNAATAEEIRHRVLLALSDQMMFAAHGVDNSEHAAPLLLCNGTFAIATPSAPRALRVPPTPRQESRSDWLCLKHQRA